MAVFCRKFAYFMAFLLFFQLNSGSAAGLIRDTEVETVFQDAVQLMAEEAGFPDGIQIRIIVDPTYNAFVVGGKTIYIHTGLLFSARSAEEILGVIAHEIGHLASGHAPLRQEAVNDANLATALTAIASAAVAAAGSAEAAVGIAIGGTDRAKRQYLSTSRKDEAVADQWALRLLDKAGISSYGLTDFMRRQASQRLLPQGRQSEYYTTHPGAKERLATFIEHTEQTLEERALSQSEHQSLARAVLKLAAYTQPPSPTKNAEFQLDWTSSSFNPTKIVPDETSLTYARAIALFRRGALDEANKLMSELLNKSNSDAWLAEFAGDIDMSAGRPFQAAAHYRNALLLRPDSPQISLSLGRALIATNDKTLLDEAIEVLLTAERGEPKWGFVKRQLAIAYGRNGRLADADVTLAEEALLANDKPRATQMARRALSSKSAPDHVKAKAEDILFQLNIPATAD